MDERISGYLPLSKEVIDRKSLKQLSEIPLADWVQYVFMQRGIYSESENPQGFDPDDNEDKNHGIMALEAEARSMLIAELGDKARKEMNLDWETVTSSERDAIWRKAFDVYIKNNALRENTFE